MADTERERRLLHDALAEHHRSTADPTPPFDALWSRAAARVGPARRARRRRLALATAGLALVLAIATTVAWWGAGRQGPDELGRALAVAAAAGEWRPPLDFLLDTPGREWLEAPPGLEPGPELAPWPAAPDLIEQGGS